MPGKVKVKIIAGRNLPVMDRSSDTTDAYVEIKLGNTTYKTDVCRKSLNPQWNSEWYRFEVDDSELQDEPLQIRLMDHDTYSANDAIGKVYLNLNPLLIPVVALPGKYGWGGEANVDQPSSSVMSGWIPVYDTMHGIRGEVNVTVKVELFSDFNKFRQSSCGVQFFCSPAIPHGYHAQVIHGFIEELVVNDDPEYQWIDKIRTPRASNEARQTLFFKLSGELQRKIGVKALDLGGNAVIGYNQCFDLEGESGIVARGIGTVVTLVKHHEMQQQLDIGIAEEKALSYLKFLAFDNGLKLDNDNVFERFTLSSPIPNTSIFVSTPDNPKEQFPRISPRKNIPIFLRQCSQPLIEYEPLPSNLKTCISSRSLSDDIKEEIALRQLLRQEEMKGGTSMSLSRKIKYLKQNMMSKKMSALKTKLSESEMQESLNLDSASISSRGESSGLRTSLIDLRELRKKKKQNSNSYMAELLVRSVMHVHTSLDCIVECHDSGPPHSSSTSVLNEELEENSSHQSNESQNTVLEVPPGTSFINKTISEPYLLLPDNTMVSPSSNASSDSDISSSDGSDSPSEIKDDKLDFDTVSLIVKNVQNEEKHEHKEASQELEFSYLNPRTQEIQSTGINRTKNIVVIPINNSTQISATAPVLQSDASNLFVFSRDIENKLEQPIKKGILTRALSRSCTDIAAANEVKSNIESENSLVVSYDNNNTENYNTVALPANVQKRIEQLRFSALFKSIAERPKTKLSKTFSISHEDISTSNTKAIENVPSTNTFLLTEPNKKRKMSKAFSISCEEIYSPNIAEIEKRIDKLRKSAVFSNENKKPEPRKRGKLTRTFSFSSEEDIDQENSPLFSDITGTLEPKRGKMSRSCEDISSPDKNEINEDNSNLLSTNIEKRIGMFKNSPLFKISIMAEPKVKGKMIRELSRSCADISSPYKNEINEETKNLLSTNIEKRIGMFKNSPLFKISIMAEPTVKGKMIRELSKSCTDISSPDKNQINTDNKDLLKMNIEKRIDMFKNSPLFKISIITKPTLKGKMNRELSRSYTNITSTDKYNINRENNSKSNPDLSNVGLVNTAMYTILTEKINLLISQPELILPRAQNQLYSQSDPDLRDDSLLKTAMQTILMEKIDLMTVHQAPVSKRVKEKFQNTVANSFSKSDPDLSSHNLITSTVNKIHSFPKRSTSFLRNTRGDRTKNLKHTCFTSDPDVRDHNTVKSLIIDKIHLLTSISPSLSRKFNGDSYKDDIRSESHSPTQSKVNSNSLTKTAMQTILMEKVNILTPQISPNGEKEFEYTKQENISTTPEHHCDSSSWTSDQHYVFEQPDDIENEHNSLFKSAMQTMLMDKLNIMAPSSPPVSTTDEEFNFNAPKTSKHPNLDKIKTTVHHAFEKVHILSPKSADKKSFNNDDPEPSLMKTAMHTMLIDKVNIMAPDVSPQATEEEYNYENIKSSSPKHDHPNLDKVKSVVHAVVDKVTHISPKSPTSPKSIKKFDFDKDHQSEPSLIKTAMNTMLIDKVNIMAPDSSPQGTEEEYKYEDTKPCSPKHDHPNLDKVKSAVHSVLDKVTHLSPKSPTSPKTNKKLDFGKNHDSEASLMKTAMHTMLIDKVNLMTPDASSHSNEEECNYEDTKSSSPKNDHPNLDKVKSAVHSVLDKVTHLSPTSPKTNKKFDFGKNHDSEASLMKTAMHTMLIDKVNIMAPDASSATEKKFYDSKHSSAKYEVTHDHPNLDKVKSAVHNVLDKVHNLSSPTKDKKFDFGNDPLDEEKSLTKSAMQTMLLDKVNITSSSSPPISSQSHEFQFNQNTHSHAVSDNAQKENFDNIESRTKTSTILIKKSETLSYPVKEELISSNTQSSSRSDIVKKHSIFGTIKKKCKSLKSKISFSKLIHKKDSSKDKFKDDGLIESAMTTILMDKVNSIQGTLNSTEENLQQKFESSSSSTPIESPPKAYIKEKLDDITLSSTCTEEPNIIIRPDSGVSCNRSTAVIADDANCNTNAEHAPCLYTSDRRIVESPVPSTEKERERDRENIRESRERHGHQRTESTGGKMSQSPARLNAIPCIHRRSSDSDLSITPKGNSLTGSDRSGGTIPGYHHIRSTLLRPTVDNFDMMEYPFLTMSKYPPGFILHLGGAVSARSVKLLERITNIEEPETRDTWWSEIRMEIRTHARALNCNAVLGYTESTSICDEVCVLSASGTAAVIALYSGELSDGVSGLPNLHKPHVPNKDLMTSSLDRTDFERDKNNKHSEPTNTNNRENNKTAQVTESPDLEATIEFSGATNIPSPPTSCRICHIPYSESTMSFRINMLYCSICKLAKVPDILLTTIEMPEGLPITGRGCFLQSYVCRPKRDLKGELNAKEISESLPFLEYELHRLLVNKMKVKAMNTLFGLKVRITIGERMLIGIATGTAVFLLPLPPPPLPKLIAGNATTEDKRLAEMQKLIVDTVKKNKEIYELKDMDVVQPIKLISDTEESDDEKSNIDLAAGNKDSCVLEVDDSEDIEVINLLVEPRPPDGFHVVNTENVPGLEELEIVRNLQMFTQVWRAKIPLNQSASHFGKHFQKLLQSVYFKLRRMIPCALCDLQFRVDLPEPDEIQLTLLGMALGLGDPMKLNKFKRKNLCHLPSKELNPIKKSDDELIFSLEEDHIPENSIPVISQGALLNPQMPKHRQKSPQRIRMNTKQRHTPLKERHGVDITPLSYVPGGKIERYLGYLNFFFIRETTSIREGGGLSGFVHSFITEVLAIVRAHVTALGGNAMVAYFMTECVLYHNAHKNQGQCLINVGGDVVFVSYFSEDN